MKLALDVQAQARLLNACYWLEVTLLALPIGSSARLENGFCVTRTGADQYAVNSRVGLTAEQAVDVVTDASFYDQTERDEWRRRLQLFAREEL